MTEDWMSGIDMWLWGKSRDLESTYPLVCHCLDTGAFAEVLWDRLLSPGVRGWLCGQLKVDEAVGRSYVAFVAALHDTGKVTEAFVRKDADAFAKLSGYPVVAGNDQNHAFAVHTFLAEALRDLWGLTAGSDAECVRLAQLLGGHHGGYSPLDGRAMGAPGKYAPWLGWGKWDQQRRLLVAALHELFGSPTPTGSLTKEGAVFITAIVILADWLASQVTYIAARIGSVPAQAGRGVLAAHLEAARHDAPGFVEAAQLGGATVDAGSFAEEFPFDPNDLQASIAQNLPGLLRGAGILLVTAPTGEGKSEASWHAARLMGEASGRRGFFLGLPTMATADQAYQRVEEYLNRHLTSRSALTLLHSMAWLSKAYDPATEPGRVDGVSSRDWVRALEWLRGHKRGMLANWALGTVDQALLAVVKVRHNVLRMLGLANKTVIIDEVHAYDAYMQGLLLRLLHWLGATGTPVILLSATVSGRMANRLIAAYLEGAGQVNGRDRQPVTYPGWAYACAVTGEVHPFQVASRHRRLAITRHEVPLVNGVPERLGVLTGELAPLLDAGGTGAVICTTVAEAQETFQSVRDWVQGSGARVDVWLLHSRFRVEDREEHTRKILARLGKEGRGPDGKRAATILISTALIEQSLDIDLDLLVTDLAPMALLLQRAGRLWRHVAEQLKTPLVRPAWASERLAVMVPTGKKGELRLPKRWIYDEALMIRTLDALTDVVDVPGDVQSLIDTVYDAAFLAGAELTEADLAHLAGESLRRGKARQAAIPTPADMRDLSELSAGLDEERLGTRWGAESGRIVCLYRNDGRLWLDEHATIPVPDRKLPPPSVTDNECLPREGVRAVVAKSVPVPSTWISGVTNQAPASWAKDPHLRSITAIVCDTPSRGAPTIVRLGDRSFELTKERGLQER
ncbi:CRISPR-associated helicase/endonuclease Cas3 [Actinorhabdospora filicis]|uniref:CRISPR-associated helicase/endonuclease Cas3 n=1 Tax=Actinorhabdospora filicis TaxID=1785913 RepID=A0A9W6SM73_9ACTN|nr:CRISPR-associated helicase Cas3' [Actinorhabdospora filicis]GLZ78354.1 CRISPR-associated helicase/endonuclease Cas3 [Actinorhabdospora filicis]